MIGNVIYRRCWPNMKINGVLSIVQDLEIQLLRCHHVYEQRKTLMKMKVQVRYFINI